MVTLQPNDLWTSCSIIYGAQFYLLKVGESRCAFVHGEEEKQLWTMDRAGQINISEFIMEEAKAFKGM